MGGWSTDYAGNAYEAHDEDAPRVYECEAHGCPVSGMADDDGPMMECEHCESWFCPAHLVPSLDGRTNVCLPCYDEATQHRLTPPDHD